MINPADIPELIFLTLRTAAFCTFVSAMLIVGIIGSLYFLAQNGLLGQRLKEVCAPALADLEEAKQKFHSSTQNAPAPTHLKEAEQKFGIDPMIPTINIAETNVQKAAVL